MKLLVFLMAVAIGVWTWKQQAAQRNAASPPGGKAKPQQPAIEQMVACAGCGVLLPKSEAMGGEGRWYCCAAHQLQGRH